MMFPLSWGHSVSFDLKDVCFNQKTESIVLPHCNFQVCSPPLMLREQSEGVS